MNQWIKQAMDLIHQSISLIIDHNSLFARRNWFAIDIREE